MRILVVTYVALAVLTGVIDYRIDRALADGGCDHVNPVKSFAVGVGAPLIIPTFALLYAVGRAYPPNC